MLGRAVMMRVLSAIRTHLNCQIRAMRCDDGLLKYVEIVTPVSQREDVRAGENIYC